VVKGTADRLLRPGQQALAAAGKEQISVTSADTEAATAWMSDEFIFRQTDVKTVMRQIARWYDMEIEYQGDMTGISITGNVSRTVYVSSLLKALELAKTIKCKIEGQRIIVMPYSL
jgi:transmembrane sensor